VVSRGLFQQTSVRSKNKNNTHANLADVIRGYVHCPGEQTGTVYKLSIRRKTVNIEVINVLFEPEHK
jgi:hypothetical protein